MATGDVVKFGGFYLSGGLQVRPTRPWRNDSPPTGASSNGNIPSFAAGQTIEIRDTPATDEHKIQWIEVIRNNKRYLYCDRVLLVFVSWADLNAQGLITGKEITIDGQKCLLRITTGGNKFRNMSNSFEGGFPTANEWDQIISNELGLSGLPVPTASDLDTTTSMVDLQSAHNQKWNWYGVNSLCQETYSENPEHCIIRGFYSARYSGYNYKYIRSNFIGWRPVLEVLESAPVISGTDTALGNKTAPFETTYSVTDPEGQSFSVVEKLNGTQIGSVNNVSSLQNRKIALTLAQWNTLAPNMQHAITIEATDEKGYKSIRTYTFVKANAAPTVSVVEPKGNLSNLAIIDSLSPVFVWSFQDTDVGDVQSAYQVIVHDTNNQLIHDSGKKTGTASYYTVPLGVLQWGVRYKWQVRVFDRYDIQSDYSFHEFFLPNRAPMATNLSPGSSDSENPAGTGVAPEFTWTFEDLDLEAQASYQLKIFKTKDDSLVYNSNRIYQNVQRHQVPANALESGTSYYAILDVWDPNGLTAQTSKAYFVTNSTPAAPILTLPVDNYRVPAKPVLQAIVGKDPEGDKQHFVIQMAEDDQFTKGVLEFASNVNRTGWKVGGVDIPTTGVSNSAEGQTVAYTLQVGLNKWATMFWRIAAIDATTSARGVWSNTRRIRIGNVLDYDTLAKPIYTGAIHARRILIALNYNLANDGANPADMKVYVTNNGGDSSPTWEDATHKFTTQDYYEFTNTSKTSENFAVAFRVVINANDSMGDIWIDGAGMTFD